MSADDIVVRGLGAVYPETVLSAAELVETERPNVLYKWQILAGLGVKEVRAAAPGDTATSLAIEACRRALKNAKRTPEDLALISSVSCVLQDVDVCSLPAKLADELGVYHAECWGIGEAACAGGYAALRALKPIMRDEEGPERALLATTCLMPGGRFFPPATVFGDGASAVVLERRGKSRKRCLRLVRSEVHAFPQFIDAFGPSAGMKRLLEEGFLDRDAWTFEIRDRARFARLSAVNYRLGGELLAGAIERAGWSVDSVTRLLPDNVTANVGHALAEKIGLPQDRVRTPNCAHYGHAFSADLFSNLEATLRTEKLQKGERVVSIGMGLGQFWGLALFES